GQRLEVAELADREAEHTQTLAPAHLPARRVAGRVPHGWMGLVVGLGQDLTGGQRPVLPLVALVLVLHPHLGELTDHILPDVPGDAGVGDAVLVKKAEDLVASGSPPRPELEPAVG